MKYCDCDYWFTGIAYICLMEGMALSKQIAYTGKRFDYCPWCGKKLKDDEETYIGALI